MKRELVLGAIVTMAILSSTAAALRLERDARRLQTAGGQPAPSAAALQAEKIRDNLYLLRGGGIPVQIGDLKLTNAGNTLAFVTATGVVLVDTKLPGWGAAIVDKVKEITAKPITTVINTHVHFDHTGGNTEFPPSVEFVTHQNTAALMRDMRPVTGGPAQPNIFKEKDGRGLPKRTFTDRLALGRGRDRIELRYFGRAHTSGDTWVVFPALGVVHVGDVFGMKVVPLLDTNNGASGVEYPHTIAKAVSALSGVETIVSGHFPSALPMAELKTYGDFVREFVEGVQAAKKSGRTIDDFVAGWKIPERFVKEGYFNIDPKLRSLRPDVEAIWNETK